jgi:hypothetical protein
MSNEVITPATVENKKPTVRPLLGENDQQLFLVVGDAKLPMLERTTPAHTRKKNGVSEQVAEKTDYVADYSDGMQYVRAATVALTSAAQEDRAALAERIFSNWVDDSIEKGVVPNPSVAGETMWDETVASKNLLLARTKRAAGQSIEDLRKEIGDLNAALVPIMEQIMAGREDESTIDWSIVHKFAGDKVVEFEALIEWKIAASERVKNITAALRAKTEAIEQAKAKRAEKKKAKKGESPVGAAASAAA